LHQAPRSAVRMVGVRTPGEAGEASEASDLDVGHQLHQRVGDRVGVDLGLGPQVFNITVGLLLDGHLPGVPAAGLLGDELVEGGLTLLAEGTDLPLRVRTRLLQLVHPRLLGGVDDLGGLLLRREELLDGRRLGH